MQLYAFDDKDRLIPANSAHKHHNYFCPGCKNAVRLRAGLYRRHHYYHVSGEKKCNGKGKGIKHLQLQHYLQKLIPNDDGILEKNFPAINRTADVVWEKEKIIFEIQCSSISADEVEARNYDYQSLSYTVIWILHDHRFNKKRPSAAEIFLRNLPHYYASIGKNETINIYDQFSILGKNFYRYIVTQLLTNLSSPKHLPEAISCRKVISKTIQKKLKNSTLCFDGDILYTMFLGTDKSLSLKLKSKIMLAVAKYESKDGNKKFLCFLKMAFNTVIKQPYRIIFNSILERVCK